VPDQTPIYIHTVATEVPEYSYTQAFALEFLLTLQGDSEKKRTFLQRVYADTGIEKRHTVIADYGKSPDEFTFYPKNVKMMPEPETWYRNDVFIEESNRISERAARALFEQNVAVKPEQITHLITVSCTGFSVPGFDLYLLKQLSLRNSVHRFHIGFMGCYAAFPAMKLARDICLAHNDAKVLIVSVELCTLHFQQKFELETVVADAIFADGCAAALISADPRDGGECALRMDSFASFVIDDSEKEMAWRIGRHGFDMRLSLYVPKLIEANVGEVVDNLLQAEGLSRGDIDLYAVHPGGRAILDKVAEALALKSDQLQHSREVLKQFGNMSSATILFVLKRILEDDSLGRIFSAAFGPGLTVESGLFFKGAFH
jgi:predicted naringenin-chalcone synthase